MVVVYRWVGGKVQCVRSKVRFPGPGYEKLEHCFGRAAVPSRLKYNIPNFLLTQTTNRSPACPAAFGIARRVPNESFRRRRVSASPPCASKSVVFGRRATFILMLQSLMGVMQACRSPRHIPMLLLRGWGVLALAVGKLCAHRMPQFRDSFPFW